MLIRPFGSTSVHAANALLLLCVIAGTAVAYAALPDYIPAQTIGKCGVIAKSTAGLWQSPFQCGAVLALFYMLAAFCKRFPESFVTCGQPIAQRWWSGLSQSQKVIVCKANVEYMYWSGFTVMAFLGGVGTMPFMRTFSVSDPVQAIVVLVFETAVLWRVLVAMRKAVVYIQQATML